VKCFYPISMGELRCRFGESAADAAVSARVSTLSYGDADRYVRPENASKGYI
jgi:hypothetical protein